LSASKMRAQVLFSSVTEELYWTQSEQPFHCTGILGSAAGSGNREDKSLHLFETVME